MKDYTCIPVGTWVEGTRRVSLANQRKPFKGWVEHTGELYTIYDIARRCKFQVAPEYVWSMGIDAEVKGALIDFTLDMKQESWFRELIGG